MRHIKSLAIFLIFSYSIFALTSNENNLFKAINEKDSVNVSNILSNSIDININALDNEGYTPLHRAIYNKDLNTINELLKNTNININSKLGMKVNIDGWYLGGASPLILASYIGESEIVNTLINNNADIKNKDDVDGSMAIHMASANGNNEVVKILLKKDPTTINDVDNRGNTPLHWAAMKDKPDTVKLLMENGADIEAKDSDGWTPLHYAAAFSSLQTVEKLVNLGADKESKTKDGNNPIYYARRDDVKNYLAGNNNIIREDEEIIEEEHTASDSNNDTGKNYKEEDLNEKISDSTDDVHNNPIIEENNEDYSQHNTELDVKQLELLLAIKNNDIIALNTLIKEGINPNFADENGYYPLHLAIINNSLDMVEILLTYKDIDKEAKLPYDASLDSWYFGGATPLIVASYIGNADIVYTLINAGCNIKARDEIDGAMPVHIAAANGNTDTLILLLEKDKTLVNEIDNNGGDTALHWASMKDKNESVNVLIKYNADSKIKNSNGDTALHYAAMYSSTNIILQICKYDYSNVNITNNDGVTPIHYAAIEDNNSAIIILYKDGKADINIKDNSGMTPLHYAAYYGNMDSVIALNENNADKSLKNNEGYIAADLASKNGYENIASYLRGNADYIPENNDKNIDKDIDKTGTELILPEYHRKPDLNKKWW